MAVILTVFIGGVIFFHLLEKLLARPVVGGYKTSYRRRGYLADVTSAIVNGPVMSAATKIAAYWMVTFVPAWHRSFGAWPWIAQFLLFFLCNDFGRYWLHRWYHASDLLWRLHRVHHATVDMDALSVIRIHIGEAIIKNCVLFLPFIVLGIDPDVIVVYSSIDVFKGFWHHANIRTYVGPVNYVFNTAELHWWHHSVERRGHRSNYGSILSIWDWLFGTAYWPKGEWPAEIGVKGMHEFPETYPGQFLSAFQTDAELTTLSDAAKSSTSDGSTGPIVLAAESKRSADGVRCEPARKVG